MVGASTVAQVTPVVNVIDNVNLKVWSDPRTARAWLYSRHKYFDGLRPADLIQEGRIEEVPEAIQTMADPTYT